MAVQERCMDEARLRTLMEDEETENLEFKGGLISRDEIRDYAVGMGNEGGGWLILGVTNAKPRSICGIPEQSPRQLQKIRDSVYDSTGIKIELHPASLPEGFVLAIRLPGRPRGTVFATRTGKYLMRSGESLRGMSIGEIEYIRKTELSYHDDLAESTHTSWQELLDPLEIDRLRKILKENDRTDLAELDDVGLFRSLELLCSEDKQSCTRAAVLLLGTREAIRKHVSSHEVKLQRFAEDELTPSFSVDMRSALLAVAERAEEVVEVVNSVQSFQQGLFRIDIPRFPKRAYREAIANALIHRDYEQPGNVAIRVYETRLEVGNPGGWFGGVNEQNVLTTESRRRNELLASVLQRIGLAERSALGVKRMFQAMLTVGKQPPEYRSTPSSITVVLHNASFDQEFAAFARRCSQEDLRLSVFDLLVLSHLRRHREITAREAAHLCQQSSADRARIILDNLRNQGLLDRRGKGKARHYVFSCRSYDWLNLEGDRPKDLGISRQTIKGLLVDELKRRKADGITNREIREWSQYGRTQITRLLKLLCEEGVIVFSGKRGLGARYWLAAYAPKEPTALRNDQTTTTSSDPDVTFN